MQSCVKTNDCFSNCVNLDWHYFFFLMYFKDEWKDWIVVVRKKKSDKFNISIKYSIK